MQIRETQLAARLRDILPKEYSFIRIARSNINLESADLMKYWTTTYRGDPPPAKPDIDLFVVSFNEFTGIELKNVRLVTANGREVVSHPFYAGLGQALALLRFGLDSALLWHCFRDEIPDKVIAKSMRDTSQLVYELKLPIGFAALKVTKGDGDFSMTEVHASLGDPPLFEYDRPPDPGRFRVENPLRDTPEGQKIREFISHIIQIPTF